jgi:hypothetical protein
MSSITPKTIASKSGHPITIRSSQPDDAASPVDVDFKQILERIATAAEGIHAELQRIGSHFQPPEVVKSRFIAGRLGCSVKWVGDLVRTGQIPKNCIVPGTGDGKQWKFYRSKIEKWLEGQ